MAGWDATAVTQFHYQCGSPPPSDPDSLLPLGPLGNRLVFFDDARDDTSIAGPGGSGHQVGSSSVFVRLNRVSARGRSSGHVDGIACHCLRRGAARPEIVYEHTQSRGQASLGLPQHLELPVGERIVTVSGSMGPRHLLRLHLLTNRGASLEVGMDVAEAENVGGRHWSCDAPGGEDW